MEAIDLIKEAMHIAGVIDLDDEPTPREISVGMNSLNEMLMQWSAQRLIIRASTPENFTLTAGQASYTIGIGGNLNTVKPITIEYGYIRDSSGVDNSLEIIKVEQYDDYEDKYVTTGLPTQLAFDPGVAQQTSQTGTVLLYPTPDKAYTLHIHSQKALTGFVTITDTCTFEDEYVEAIVYNLAARIWRKFRSIDQPIPTDIATIARDALMTLERINSITPVVQLDLPRAKTGTGYNIMSDQFD
jgi:hypothetical protein